MLVYAGERTAERIEHGGLGAYCSMRARSYADHLYAHGMSRTTVLDYERAIGQANRYLFPTWTIDTVPGPVLTRFVETLPHTYASRRRFQLAIHHYWSWTRRPNPPLGAIPVPRQPKALCRALEPDQARHLAQVAKDHARTGPEGVAVLLGLYMALRRFEIAKIHRDDLANGELAILGKGHKAAVLPLHPALPAYLDLQWARSRSPWLFPGRDRTRPVCTATINAWIDRVASAAGLSLTTHQLRHTCLAEMHDNTKDLRAVSLYARHERLETTMIYTRTTKVRLRELQGALGY